MKLASNPVLKCGFCSEDEFEIAIRIICGSYQKGGVPVIETGYFGPGAVEAVYGHGWFSLDYALMVDAAKWLNFQVAKDFVNNMKAIQKQDGRIILDTCDTHKKEKNWSVGTNEVSSLPQIFETAYRVAIMYDDESFKREVYEMLASALGWWFEKRQDKQTKLITAVTEETFPANHMAPPMAYAPMDTNERVIIGCENTANLAELLGKTKEAAYFREKKQEIIDAVEQYLWNEEDGCYYPYLISRGEQYHVLLWHTFLGFSFTTEEKKHRLKRLLLDNSHFGWDFCPIPTASKKDKVFMAGQPSGLGPGYASVEPTWRGGVILPANLYVIEALERAGYMDLAGDLALKTVRTFSNFRLGEFANPLTGNVEGLTMSYGWTASGYFQIIVEKLLGIRYTHEEGLTVKPNLPVDSPELYRYAVLSNLALPNGKIVNIVFEREKISVQEIN